MKRKMEFKSVKTRLVFWFLVIALAPLTIGGIITYQQREAAIKQREFNKLAAIRDLKVKQVNNWLDERIADIQTISDDYEIRALEDVLHRDAYTQEDINIIRIAEELLSRYVKNYKDYEELFIINPDSGRIDISTREAQIGKDKSKDPYFTRAMESGEAYIKDVYYSQTIQKPSMEFSIPIYSLTQGEHIVGVLVARIDLQRSLYDLLLDRTGMGKTGETYIVDRDLFALNELKFLEHAPLKLKVQTEPAARASEGGTGVMVTADYRSEEVLSAYTYIPRTGWGLLAEQDLK